MMLREHVAELVYAYASEAYPVRDESSTLSVPTKIRMTVFVWHEHSNLLLCVESRKAQSERGRENWVFSRGGKQSRVFEGR